MSWSKLFSDLVCSSIWNEDDATRIVWITMLAIKGPNHIVRATVGGLAHQARVPLDACRVAINKLSNPDPDGLGQPYEGRRIQEVDHGWLVLNGAAYRDRRDESYRKVYQAEWIKAKRIKRKLSTSPVDVDTKSTSVDTSRVEQSRAEKKDIDQPHQGLDPAREPNERAGETEGEAFFLSARGPTRKLPRPKSVEAFIAGAAAIGIPEQDLRDQYALWDCADWHDGLGQPVCDWKRALISLKQKNCLPSQTRNGTHKRQKRDTCL